jgi:hypothetical protein
MIRDLPKILFLSVCAVLLGIGLAKYAKADGYEPGQAGYSYKDGPTAYSYSHRPYSSPKKRYVAKCDRHMSAYECRRFREVMAKRANARSQNMGKSHIKPNSRYASDGYSRRRYAETGYVRSDADYRGRRECKAPVMAEGDERGTRGRAEGSAVNAWKRSVVNRWGARYSSVDKARGFDPDCNIIRTNRFGVKIWLCSVSARPCRED